MELDAVPLGESLLRSLVGPSMGPLALNFSGGTARSCHLSHLAGPPLGRRCPGFVR